MREPSDDDLQAVLQNARKQGAKAAEVLYEAEDGIDLTGTPGRPTVQSEVSKDFLRVRVWTEAGEGVAVGAFRDAPRVLEAAFGATRPASPHAGPVAHLRAPTAALALEDRRYASLTLDDRHQVLHEAASAARLSDPRFAATGLGYEDRWIRRAFASTTGNRARERSTTFRAWASATVATQQAKIPLRSTVSGRSFSSVASLPFGVELARRAAALLEPQVPLPTGALRVLLGAPQTASLMRQLAALCLPDRLDDTFLPSVVLDPRFHVVDDPTMPSGLRSRSFDDRGVPPVPLTLFREGRVHATLLDAQSAAVRDVRPSGHEVGDHLEVSNLVLRHGTRSVHVILAELGGTTFAPDDLGDFVGLDPRSGRFEATVHGSVYEGARRIGAAHAVRLTGSVGEFLANIIEISGETDRIGSVDAPAIVVGGFSVA